MNEARLRRLAEIGIDVYRPRRAALAVVAGSARDEAASPPVAAADAAQGGVALVAGPADGRAALLVAAVERALAGLRVASRRVDAADEAGLSSAQALVAFGEASARAAGRVLSAQRQREIGWVVTREATELARDAGAKRALWSELKRVARGLRAGARG